MKHYVLLKLVPGADAQAVLARVKSTYAALDEALPFLHDPQVYASCVERDSNADIMAVLGRLGFPWVTLLFVFLMTLAVLTSAAGLANAGCRRFDKLFGFIENLQLRRTVITVIMLGIAALGASFGMKALLQKGTSYVGYLGIPALVIPAFTWVRSRLDQ